MAEGLVVGPEYPSPSSVPDDSDLGFNFVVVDDPRPCGAAVG
jgi:hypothetical protein